MDLVARSRIVRSTYFGSIVNPLRKIGITANHLTSLSFILGVVAVWFLFDNHFYFVFFGLFHLLMDSLDGVLARSTKVTLFGKHFDTISDNLLLALLLLKSHSVLGHWLYAAAAFFYAVMLGFYLLSRAPPLFMRTVTFIGYFLQLFFLSATVVGIASIIGILLQLNYHFTFFKPRRKPM